MADIHAIFDNGIKFQIRRCLAAMTDQQIDRGLTAIEDGHSSWSDCFWARVFEEHDLTLVSARPYTDRFKIVHTRYPYNVEMFLRDQLNLESHVPVRIVYNLFDTMGKQKEWTRAKMGAFIKQARLESDTPILDAVLAGISNADLNREMSYGVNVCGAVPSGGGDAD